MPFGGILSLAGPAIGIGSSLAGLAKGAPSSKVQLPQTYNAPYRNEASIGAYGMNPELSNYNVAGQYLPQYQQIAQSSVNNPYAPSWLQGAEQASQMGMGAGQGAFGAGGALTSNALSQLPNVNALMSLGFDPQNALYSKLQQQNTDQTNARLGMSGLQTTPYGAGVANQSNQDFNLGWQNNLLSRAVNASGAAGNLMGAIGGQAQTGTGLQGQGVQEYLASAGIPYGTFNNINANALGTLGQAGQFGQMASQIPQQQIQNYLNYLQTANQTQNANTGVAQLGLQQANQAFNQNAWMGNQLGQSVAGLAKGWGQSPWGTSGGGSGGVSGGGSGGFSGFG
jgi:hypothetical protein